MDNKKYKEMIHSIIVPNNLSMEEQSEKYLPLNKFLQTEIPSQLYRFRQCNENSISAFDQDQLWFALGSEMNDDFDALLFFNKQDIKTSLENAINYFPENILSFINEKDISYFEQNLITREMLSIFQSKLTEMCDKDIENLKNQAYEFFTQQLDDGIPYIQHIIQNTLKFACFSEAINSPAMWGYYADSGKGFALAYDFRNGIYTDCMLCPKSIVCHSSHKACLYKMIYDDTPFDATEYATWLLQIQILRNMLSNVQQPMLDTLYQKLITCPDLFMSTKVLLHKSTLWKHEHEWRLIYTCNLNDSLNEKFLSAKKRPTALYLGRKISKINEKVLCHIAIEKNIPIYKMVIKEEESSYKLIPKAVL